MLAHSLPWPRCDSETEFSFWPTKNMLWNESAALESKFSAILQIEIKIDLGMKHENTQNSFHKMWNWYLYFLHFYSIRNQPRHLTGAMLGNQLWFSPRWSECHNREGRHHNIIFTHPTSSLSRQREICLFTIQCKLTTNQRPRFKR